MQRIDLPEIEDWRGCPAWVRDAMTGYLQTVIELSRPYAVVAGHLAALLRERGTPKVVDLASGAGGPWPLLLDALRGEGVEAEVTLTDLNPNLRAAGELERATGVTYHREPVSALAVPSSLPGVRTMFTGLHHFDRQDLATILRSAQEARVPFLAAEATHRSPRGILVTLLIPLLVLLLMPRVKPRRIVPLVLTYLPPVLPLLIGWDGLASTLKTYRAEELESVVAEIREPAYDWSVQEISVPRAPIPVTLLVGRPAARPLPFTGAA
jgi:hypothetical protein